MRAIICDDDEIILRGLRSVIDCFFLFVPQEIRGRCPTGHMKTAAFYIFSFRKDTPKRFGTYLTCKFSIRSF